MLLGLCGYWPFREYKAGTKPSCFLAGKIPSNTPCKQPRSDDQNISQDHMPHMIRHPPNVFPGYSRSMRHSQRPRCGPACMPGKSWPLGRTQKCLFGMVCTLSGLPCCWLFQEYKVGSRPCPHGLDIAQPRTRGTCRESRRRSGMYLVRRGRML